MGATFLNFLLNKLPWKTWMQKIQTPNGASTIYAIANNQNLAINKSNAKETKLNSETEASCLVFTRLGK